MLPGTRVAIEALLYTRELPVEGGDSGLCAPAYTRERSIEGGGGGGSGWSARLPCATLATYRRGGLAGRRPPRPLTQPRVFFRSARAPKRWDPAEPRTKRPRPPSSPPLPAAPAAAAAAAAAAAPAAKGTETAADRPAWTAGNSPRVHARSVYACTPLMPRPASARIFHSDDPLARPDDARPALQLREPMGVALHGEWVGCHPGRVKHRGAWGSAPGWVDYAREATCTPSRGRVRRTGTSTSTAARQRQRRGQEASPRNVEQQGQAHEVLQYDARQMRDMLVVGAEKLQSTTQAQLRIDGYRDRQRKLKRATQAAVVIQTRWRGGTDRRKLDEMHWGAMIVQANFRSRMERSVFAQMREAAFLIQKHTRGHSCRQHMQRVKRSTITVQACFRGMSVRNHLHEKSVRDKQLLQLVARAEEAAAAKMQAVYRGLKGRRKARAERLRQMDEDQRLSEIERTQRAHESEVMLKRQAAQWKQQQEEQARVHAERQAYAESQGLEVSRIGPGDTGAIVRVTTRGAPGYGTFVAAFGLRKTTDWIEKSKGDLAFRK
eukprot:COSAG02_NODE_14_length_56855_cov_512.793661_28_plen_549_part_00